MDVYFDVFDNEIEFWLPNDTRDVYHISQNAFNPKRLKPFKRWQFCTQFILSSTSATLADGSKIPTVINYKVDNGI